MIVLGVNIMGIVVVVLGVLLALFIAKAFNWL